MSLLLKKKIKNHNIASSPISVFFKGHGKDTYEPRKGLKKHNLWLEFDEQGHINLNIRIYDKSGSWKIRLNQWDVFNLLLIRLNIRPIIQGKNQIYPRDILKKFPDVSEMYSVEQVKIEYDEALYNLREIINFSDGEKKELAEKQLERLISKQWIVDLMAEIDYAKCMKKDGLDKEIKRLCV